MKPIALASMLFLVGCGLNDTARESSWPEAYFMMNGTHIFRFLATPDNTTAESNLTASGGAAVAYTLLGTERLCYECATTDAYVEVIAAASVTAGGAKGRLVKASNAGAGDLVCDTLKGQLSVSFLCSAAGPCSCKAFEVR